MKGFVNNMIENILEKRNNENEFEHHKRLVYGKLKDKTLSEYDYAELAPYVYGKQYTADETRKRMYGSVATLEIMDELGVKNFTEDDMIAEIKAKQIDLQKEKQMFYDQRREFNKLVSAEGRRDHLYERLAEAANDLANTVGDAFSDVDVPMMETSDNEFILFLSDWHYGMTADNIWNKFNVEICKKRIDKVLCDAIERITRHQCKRGKVVILGDMLSGGLHCSVRVASEELVCDQLMQVSEILAQFIAKLSNYVEHVDVYSTFGNHARTIPNKKDNIHMDNMERIIPWWLAQRFAAARMKEITVHTESEYEFILFESCYRVFCATHGDLDKACSATQYLPTLFNKVYDTSLDYIVVADKHHQESYEEMGIESILTGSLCGTDDYANSKRLYSEPFQLLLIVNPVDGVDARYKLRCDIV
jgi:hypothetical protein